MSQEHLCLVLLFCQVIKGEKANVIVSRGIPAGIMMKEVLS